MSFKVSGLGCTNSQILCFTNVIFLFTNSRGFKLISYLTKTIKHIKNPHESKDSYTFAKGVTAIPLSQISATAADCDKHSDDIECAILAGDILFTGSDDGLIKVFML